MYKTLPQIFSDIVKGYPGYTVQMSKDKSGVFQSEIGRAACRERV